MRFFHQFTYSISAYQDEWIRRIVNQTYIPGFEVSDVYKERAYLCDTVVNGFLKDARIENPESEVWDNRRKS
jgi:hypothetical protein